MQPQLFAIAEQAVSLDEIRQELDALASLDVRPLNYDSTTDQWSTWEAIVHAGHSYMVGLERSKSEYMAVYTRNIRQQWAKLAHQYAKQNPDKQLFVYEKNRHWVISLRGEFVQFHLPHQSYGGENTYVSRDGKTWLHVNAD